MGIKMTIDPNDFYTKLEDGTYAPVRLVGDRYIVSYDCIDAPDFLELIRSVVDEDEAGGYLEMDVYWALASEVDFEINPKIVFSKADNYEADYDATPITVIQRW